MDIQRFQCGKASNFGGEARYLVVIEKKGLERAERSNAGRQRFEKIMLKV